MHLLVACLLLLSGSIAQAGESDPFTLNASGMSLVQVFKLLSEEGGLDLVVDSGVTGSVTVFLEDVTVLRGLETICRTADLAFVREDGIYHVMPAAKYKERYGIDFSSSRTTRIFALEYANAPDLQQALEKIKSPTGIVIVDERSSTIAIVDASPILDRAAALIDAWDVPMSIEVFSLQHAEATVVGQQLQLLVPNKAAVQVDASTNRVIIRDSPDRMAQYRSLIESFDVPRMLARRTFALQYADHAAVANAITPDLTPGVGRVQPDTGSRKIVVVDFPKKLETIAALIDQIDVPSAEVLIEARIFQVTLTDDLKFGVDWEAVSHELDNLTFAGSFPPAITDDSSLEVTAGTVEADDYTALVRALSTIGKTNLLSSPRILTVDGHEAKILVGSTTPFTTVDTREEGGTIRTFEKVTYVETGVKLEVTPRIHDSQWVTLDVRPEVSSVVAFSEDRIPVVETKTTETSVRVLTGRTVIIAGLVEDQEIETRKGIPLLDRIPFLGRFFGSTDRRTEKRELVVLLTPTIVADEADYGKIEETIPEKE